MKSDFYRNVWFFNLFLFLSWNAALGQLQPVPINYNVSLVKDINPGSGGSFSGRDGVVIGNTLYFPASGEVWKTTGTEASTLRVKDINPDGVADPNALTDVNGTLFFVATGSSGREIYKSDGTAAGTVLIKDINPGGHANPVSLSVCNGLLFFFADNGVDGEELWRTDGTSAGTLMVKNINKYQGSRVPDFNGRMAILNNVAYFVANDGLTGDELWRTDGTTNGTYLVKDINLTGSIETLDLVAMNNMLYFLADDGIHGTELWRSDGTTIGTSLVKDLQQNGGVTQESWLVVVGNTLFMSLLVNGDIELYKSDGTAAGTMRVKNINTSGGSGPQGLTSVGSHLFFTAYEPVHGRELWKSDGTASGTVLVKDLTIKGSSNIEEMKEAHGRLFFTLESDEPHVSNGTAGGTKRIANIYPSGSAVARTYMAMGTQVFFFAGTPGLGRELYKAVPCNFCAVPASASANIIAQERLPNTEMRVLGNPVKESITVDILSKDAGPAVLELLTNTGIILEKRQIHPGDIPSRQVFDVSRQPAGILMLRMKTSQGDKLVKIAKID